MTVRIGENKKSMIGGTSAAREDLLVAHGNEFPVAQFSNITITDATLDRQDFVVPLQNEYTVTKAVYRETTAIADGTGGSVSTLIIEQWAEGTSTGAAATTTITKNIDAVTAKGVSKTTDLAINLTDVSGGSLIKVRTTQHTGTGAAGVISLTVYAAEKDPA